MAFLISRYLAGDSIERKMKSPRWRKLDKEVEHYGWKVVVLARLIPLFPFNLLNYAFGLTKVKLLHYAVATFFCMLPACIAFIVFSSSLPDIVRGRIPPTFMIGLSCHARSNILEGIYTARRELALPHRVRRQPLMDVADSVEKLREKQSPVEMASRP
ncbi:MAG: VTT domain-containing protein [Desulfobacteraceae bacterium]|nr:VTT domain-containing protein [Desulfobacteraceae bacterium]